MLPSIFQSGTARKVFGEYQTYHLQYPEQFLLSAYKMLEEKKSVWVALGASRINTKPNTLEGRIKSDFNSKLNGLSTVSWIAAILVKAFDNIKFNYEAKGQVLKML